MKIVGRIILWIVMLFVGLFLLNFFTWALFAFFPYAVLALLIMACIFVGAIQRRYWWY